MLAINQVDYSNFHEKLKKIQQSGASSILYYEDFMKDSIPHSFRKAKEYAYKRYQKQVKFAKERGIPLESINPQNPDDPIWHIWIPKPLSQLLRGDFKPAKVIDIPNPFHKDNPNNLLKDTWFASSADSVHLPVGYQDGDSSKPSDVSFNDKDIHAVCVGKTGVGKSVTLNTINSGIMREYAPWEVNFYMLDPKIAEFTVYADLGIPHVKAVGATTDTDYIASVLEAVAEEMEKYNTVYGNANLKNISDFRLGTGLCMPRTIIEADEFQMLFQNANNRQQKQLEGFYKKFSKLGRSTGYHLLMASQEFGSVVPSDVLNQITIRMALSCPSNVSEAILKNEEAASIEFKGRIIINLNPFKPKNIDENKHFVVPLQLPAVFESQAKRLNILANKSYRQPLDYYKGDIKIYESEYSKYLKQFKDDETKLLLSQPSFFISNGERVLKLNMDGSDIESILIMDKGYQNLFRYTSMLIHSMKRWKSKVNHAVFYGDSNFINHPTVGKFIKEEANLVVEMKLAKERGENKGTAQYQQLRSLVLVRQCLLEVDKYAFNNIEYTQLTDDVFSEIIKAHPEMNTREYKNRTHALLNLELEYMLQLLGEEYPGPGHKDYLQFVALASEEIYFTLLYYEDYGARDCRLHKDMFPKTFIWVLGYDKIEGFGRDAKGDFAKQFGFAMIDGATVNIRFIVTTKLLEEGEEMKSGIRYIILDKPDSSLSNKFKLGEAMPEIVGEELGLVCDKVNQECYKFKRMYFDDEY